MKNLKWFSSCKNIDELKKSYRKLAMQYHPDINPNTNQDDMKSINNEYDIVFTYLINHATIDQKIAYNKTGHGINDGYKEIINKIIHIPNIIIEVCGSWIWISGNSKPFKNQLKSIGFYWAAKKMQWYWRPSEYKAPRSKKFMDMDYIRSKYGSEKVESNPYQQFKTI